MSKKEVEDKLTEIQKANTTVENAGEDLKEQEETRSRLENQIANFDNGTQKAIQELTDRVKKLSGKASMTSLNSAYLAARKLKTKCERIVAGIHNAQFNLTDESAKDEFLRTSEEILRETEESIDELDAVMTSIEARAEELSLVKEVGSRGGVRFVEKEPELNNEEQNTEETAKVDEQVNTETATKGQEESTEKGTESTETIQEVYDRTQNPTPDNTELSPEELQRQAAAQFVEHYITSVAISNLYSDDRERRNSAEAQYLLEGLKKANPTANNPYEESRETMMAELAQHQEAMYAFVKGKTPEELDSFITSVSTEYHARVVPTADGKPVQDEKATRDQVAHDITELKEAYDKREAEAQQGQEAQEAQAKPPVKINYTVKGCDLALKSINKLLAKLEEKIKEDKAAAAAKKASEAMLAKQKAKESSTETEETAEEQHVDEQNREQTPIASAEQKAPELDPKLVTAAKQAYLTLVMEQLGVGVTPMNAQQLNPIIQSLNTTMIGSAEIADATPEKIVELLHSKGFDLNSVANAVEVQLGQVSEGKLSADGTTIVLPKKNGEEKPVLDNLMNRCKNGCVVAGGPAEYSALDLATAALGSGLFDEATLDKEVHIAIEALKEAGEELTPENIGNLISGNLQKTKTDENGKETSQLIYDTEATKQRIKQQIKTNCPTLKRAEEAQK